MIAFTERLRRRYSYSLILLRELVITDFKLRYQGSALGYLWSTLKPLALFLILYVVFVEFLPVGKAIENYALFLLLGIVIWNFFSEITMVSISSIVGRGDLLRKINFPKYVIVFATTLSALINLGINLIVFAAFMAYKGVVPDLSTIILLPILLMELFLLALGVAFLLSSLYVKFRDVNYIWEIFMQGAFYATPVIYPLVIGSLALIPVKYAQLLILNPVAQVIQDLRYIIITHQAATIEYLYGSSWMRVIPIGLSIAIFVFGALYFRKHSRNFAEEV